MSFFLVLWSHQLPSSFCLHSIVQYSSCSHAWLHILISFFRSFPSMVNYLFFLFAMFLEIPAYSWHQKFFYPSLRLKSVKHSADTLLPELSFKFDFKGGRKAILQLWTIWLKQNYVLDKGLYFLGGGGEGSSWRKLLCANFAFRFFPRSPFCCLSVCSQRPNYCWVSYPRFWCMVKLLSSNE